MQSMASKTETVRLDIPRDIVEHAKDSGVSIEEFRRSLELFGIMQLVSETSGLSRRRADTMSERIKSIAWRKTVKRLRP